MNVPGSNLLASALTIIAPQRVDYLRYDGQTTRADLVKVPTYAEAVGLYGSFQAIDGERAIRNGLDPSKTYAAFYASVRFQTPGRDVSSDVVLFDGRRWEAVDSTGWFAMDGWDALLLVDTGVAPDE